MKPPEAPPVPQAKDSEWSLQCFTTNHYHPFYAKNSLCSVGQSDRQGQAVRDGRARSVQANHRVFPTGTGADGVILVRRAFGTSWELRGPEGTGLHQLIAPRGAIFVV